jgi:hypothetical protein
MTVKEWLATNPLFYKDCLITEMVLVGPRHVSITVQIPLPVGGVHIELLALDAKIEEWDR